MKLNRFGLFSLLVLLIMCGYAALSYGEMPDQIAVHFDLEGTPNRFEDKATFHLLYITIALLTAMFFAFLLPWIVSKVPDKWTNIPNREYWFATPERRARVKRFQDLVVSSSGLYMMLVLLLGYVSIVNVNTKPLVDIPVTAFIVAIGVMTVIYVILLFVWLMRFTRRPS